MDDRVPDLGERLDGGLGRDARLTAERVEQVALVHAVQGTRRLADVGETARALNRMNESYLLDAFGREPRVSTETAVQTLTEIWDAVIHR